MDTSSSDYSVLNPYGESEQKLYNFERNLERTYQTWENLVQNIRTYSDIDRFLDTIHENKHFYETEFNNKKQCLTKCIFQIDAELVVNTERLEKLQNQRFATNMKNQLAILQQTHQLNSIRARHTNIEQAQIKLMKVYKKFSDKFDEAYDHVWNINLNLEQQQQQNEVQSQGLTQETIQTFTIFTADKSLVGNQCSICMEDIDVGRRMRRLTCDGQHYFCQECIEGWFADHNTCPLCRHLFN